MSSEYLEIAIREATSSDLDFVKRSWHTSFEHSQLASTLSREVYLREWWLILDELCRRSSILIAADPDNADVIIGFIVFEDRESDHMITIHYAYTKRDFRQAGVASALAQAAGIKDHNFIFTHRSIDAIKILSKWKMDKTKLPVYNFVKIWVSLETLD